MKTGWSPPLIISFYDFSAPAFSSPAFCLAESHRGYFFSLDVDWFMQTAANGCLHSGIHHVYCKVHFFLAFQT